MVRRVDDEHFPEVGRKVVLGPQVIDDLANVPMLGDGADVALHQAPCSLLRIAERVLDGGPVFGLHLLEDGLLLVLVEVLDQRDRVVGLHLTGDVRDLLRLELVEQALADIFVHFGEHVGTDDAATP